MSRSGYDDDLDQWSLIRWRGAVTSAIRGARGQSFLRELRAALDLLPEPKRLIAHALEENGEVCALGSVGRERKLNMVDLDPEEHRDVAKIFALSHALTCEIAYMNDEGGHYKETPEQRYERMSQWVNENLRDFAAYAVGRAV